MYNYGINIAYPIYMEVYPWFIPGLYTRYTNVFRLYHVYHMYIHMISNVYVAGFRKQLSVSAVASESIEPSATR